jgi:alanyl-tRNA synthetase
VFDGKPSLLVAVTQDLVERGLDAGKIVRQAAPAIGGGGKDALRLGEALESVKGIVAQMAH